MVRGLTLLFGVSGRVHYERAGALNPNDPDVFAYRGMLALFEGAFDAVFVWLDRARRLNTHHAGWYLWAIGTAHYGRREYEAALPPLRWRPATACARPS